MNENLPTLDTVGLLCPLPLIRAQEFAKTLNPGTKFILIASDPGVHYDIPAWCRMYGHEIVNVDDSLPNSVIQMCVRLRDEGS